MIIRELSEDDIKEASDLVVRVFMEFEAPDYPQEGINNFLDFVCYKNLSERYMMNEMKIFGAFIEDSLVGVIAYRNESHISLLFVDKKYHYKGIAKKLFERLVTEIRKKNDYITVNSSPYAVDVYRRFGFFDIKEEQIEDGIRYIPMKYNLIKNYDEVVFRRATVEDIEILVHLRKKQLIEEGALPKEDITDNLIKFYREGMEKDEFISYVGEAKGVIIATAGLCLYRLVPYFENPEGKVANIANMYTLPDFRRRGISIKLLDKVVNEAVNKGYRIIRVSASKYGKFLYTQYGFNKKENSYELIK